MSFGFGGGEEGGAGLCGPAFGLRTQAGEGVPSAVVGQKAPEQDTDLVSDVVGVGGGRVSGAERLGALLDVAAVIRDHLLRHSIRH